MVNLDEFKKSYISFDYGSHWRQIKSPEVDN